MGNAARPQPGTEEKAVRAPDATAQETEQAAAPAGSGGGQKTLSERLPTPWLFPVVVYAATWGLIVASWQVANAIYRSPLSWDAYFLSHGGSFLETIAIHGYAAPDHPHVPAARTGVFPVLPLLVKTVSDMTRHDYLTAGLLVQVVMGAAAAVAVWALAAGIKDRRVADGAVLLFCAFPGALAFAMLQPQPLGIAFAAASLLMATRRKWMGAGGLGLIAAATAPLLAALVLALAVTAVHALWSRRDWRALAAPVLASLGVLGYFVLLGGDYGDYLYWFRREYAILRHRVDWGARQFHVLTWTDPTTSGHALINVVLIVMFCVLVAGVVAMLAARLPLPVTVYTVATALMLVLSATAGPQPGSAWLALGIFPGLAAKLPRWAFWPLLIASAGLLAFLAGWWPYH